MLNLFATKFVRAILTMLLVVTFIFVILRISGDPADVLLGDDVDPEVAAYYHELWGLDKPMYEQYGLYVVSVLQGDLGNSFRDNRPVVAVIAERAPVTLQLGLAALAFALVLGMPLGIFAALKHNTVVDRAAMTFAVLGYAIPNFFFGILLILLFSLYLRWLPSSGSTTVWHMIMPALTLGTASAGALARFTRSAMLEVLNKPFMRTAKAKGAGWHRRIALHAIPNAAIPVVTILGFKIGGLISGSIITENVFGWPGLGQLLVSSVSARDLPVVQALVMLVALTMVTANLTVDLLYGWIDPRTRAARAARELA